MKLKISMVFVIITIIVGMTTIAVITFVKKQKDVKDLQNKIAGRIIMIPDESRSEPSNPEATDAIRFVNSRGKTIKTMEVGFFQQDAFTQYAFPPKERNSDWQMAVKPDSADYLVMFKETWDNKNGNKLTMTFVDATSRVKWVKNLLLYETCDEETYAPYYVHTSVNGSRIVLAQYVPVKDEKVGKYKISVYDTLGNMAANAPELLWLNDLGSGDVQITRDGKIVAVKTGFEENGKWIRALFFLEVETGKSKMARLYWDGKKWIGEFDVTMRSGSKSRSNRIWIWCVKDGEYLTFDEIPEILRNIK